MATFGFKRHLRLVSDANNDLQFVNSTILGKSLQAQLPLSFSDDLLFIFYRESDVLGSDSILRSISSFKPCFLFDVRLAPRLDFIAPSRLNAFRKFLENQVDYVDILGASGIETHRGGASMPEEWCSFFVEKFRESSMTNRTCIFIFDNDDVLNRSERILASSIEKAFDNLSVRIVKENHSGLIAM